MAEVLDVSVHPEYNWGGGIYRVNLQLKVEASSLAEAVKIAMDLVHTDGE